MAALRERLRAEATRTFSSDPSQMPVCTMALTAERRRSWEAKRRSASDTIIPDSRLLCVVNDRPLTGPEAATAIATVPAKAIKHLSFLTGPGATAIYGTRGAAGVVLVTIAK